MKTLAAIIILLSFSLAFEATAQLPNIPKVVKKKATDRVNQEINKGIDKGLDEVTGKNKKTESARGLSPKRGLMRPKAIWVTP